MKATDGSAQKYGLDVNQLQEGIQIAENAISGTLKQVSKYPGFGDEEANSPNYYLALDVDVPEGATVTTKITGGKNRKYVDLTEDQFCVYRIKDPINQKIQIKTEIGSRSTMKVYDLAGLKLEASGHFS